MKTRPKLPWYYEVFFRHFKILSNKRTTSLSVTGNGAFCVEPNPIDIATILLYNKSVAKMDNPADFLYLMHSLDDIYLKRVSAE